MTSASSKPGTPDHHPSPARRRPHPPHKEVLHPNQHHCHCSCHHHYSQPACFFLFPYPFFSNVDRIFALTLNTNSKGCFTRMSRPSMDVQALLILAKFGHAMATSNGINPRNQSFFSLRSWCRLERWIDIFRSWLDDWALHVSPT